jgi:hypothetical protein
LVNFFTFVRNTALGATGCTRRKNQNAVISVERKDQFVLKESLADAVAVGVAGDGWKIVLRKKQRRTQIADIVQTLNYQRQWCCSEKTPAPRFRVKSNPTPINAAGKFEATRTFVEEICVPPRLTVRSKNVLNKALPAPFCQIDIIAESYSRLRPTVSAKFVVTNQRAAKFVIDPLIGESNAAYPFETGSRAEIGHVHQDLGIGSGAANSEIVAPAYRRKLAEGSLEKMSEGLVLLLPLAQR